ncbi:hypothetical protein [Syntrophothermus lipocalidus]|uniref:Uncharacterized protein n=1 Tax=Syntrophothermus lipocalidus (strain DSM 12680 / TGB-C1) TaxID=643648 RepID=D7CIL2_SYNLT|nr:hypothetical protein [Syntrophothermus lipocalidus]ADI00877.1 hypothetical protein Slip_0075 [Syntrophothermus lipocalidus DSM 12680]
MNQEIQQLRELGLNKAQEAAASPESTDGRWTSIGSDTRRIR